MHTGKTGLLSSTKKRLQDISEKPDSTASPGKRRNSVQPVIEDYAMPLVYIKKDTNSKSMSRSATRSFYFDKYSRKVYFDEETKKLKNANFNAPIEGTAGKPNEQL